MNSFAQQKSQEVSLALIRISIYIRRGDLRRRLENLAFQLLEVIASRNFEQSLIVINTLESLILFGKSVYEIEPINAEVILREVGHLKTAMLRLLGLNGDNDISALFSGLPVILDGEEGREESGKEGGDFLRDAAIFPSQIPVDDKNNRFSGYGNGNGNGNGSGNGNGNGNGNSAIDAAIRQGTIIERIRQSGNMAMRDLIAAFPSVSERTLRYDLKKLCDQDLLQRVGNGGPSSYYISK